MKVRNIIYGLRDPRNDVYYYVGKSSIGVNRPLTHLKTSHSQKIYEWIENLKSSGFSPLIDIIEEVEDINELPDREKHWINHYHCINPELLNIQSLPKEIQEIRSEKTDEEFVKLLDFFYKIPEILKRERVLRGIKQDELSEMTGLSRSTISLIERGSNVSYNSMKLYVESILKRDRVSLVNNERVRHSD